MCQRKCRTSSGRHHKKSKKIKNILIFSEIWNIWQCPAEKLEQHSQKAWLAESTLCSLLLLRCSPECPEHSPNLRTTPSRVTAPDPMHTTWRFNQSSQTALLRVCFGCNWNPICRKKRLGLTFHLRRTLRYYNTFWHIFFLAV